jgi:hypothetical protein
MTISRRVLSTQAEVKEQEQCRVSGCWVLLSRRKPGTDFSALPPGPGAYFSLSNFILPSHFRSSSAQSLSF